MSSGVSAFKENDIRKLLHDVLKQNNLLHAEILIDKGSNKCDGFMSVMTKATIEDGNNKLYVIIKSAPVGDFRKMLPVAETFDREICFYKTIFPAMIKFQADRHVTAPFQNVPKCYLTSSENLKECIVMENLRENDYDLFNGKLQMDDIHIKLILKTYAKYHAISFAMQDQDISLYKKLTENFTIELFKSFPNDLMDQFVIAVDKTIDLYTDDASIQRRLKKYQASITPFFDSFDKKKWKYEVICHGDCWSNNMMFKYQNMKPVDIRLLDFQVVRTGSPVLDLSYSLYSSSSHDIYENLEKYLQFYHDNLKEHLEVMGSNVELYTFSALKEDWKKYSFFGYIMAPIIMRTVLKEEDEKIDFTDILGTGNSFSDVFNKDLQNVSGVNERLRRLTKHMIDNEFI